MKPRKPTDEEYRSYDGMHCRSLWRELSDAWTCPVCGRTKREIMLWGIRSGSNAVTYGSVGFKCGLHRHHDHSTPERFKVTVVCGSCNLLDARLKRKVGARKDFSFSPEELSQCLTSVKPNESIKSTSINYGKAAEIYKRVR